MEKIRLFILKEQAEEFQEQEIREDTPLYEYLDPKLVLLFVDPQNKMIWVWYGRKAFKMAFNNKAFNKALAIKQKHDIPFKITMVRQDKEPNPLKEILGLKFEVDLKVPNYDFMPKLLDLEFKKIESLLKESPDNELVIERQYLPEIIDEGLLEISKNDNLPRLTPTASNKIKYRGIITEHSPGEVKLSLVVKRVEELLNNRFGKLTPEDLQSMINRRDGIKTSVFEILSKFGREGIKYLMEELNKVQELIYEEVGIELTLDKHYRTLKVEKINKKNRKNKKKVE
jgi:hypothetical protein